MLELSSRESRRLTNGFSIKTIITNIDYIIMATYYSTVMVIFLDTTAGLCGI